MGDDPVLAWGFYFFLVRQCLLMVMEWEMRVYRVHERKNMRISTYMFSPNPCVLTHGTFCHMCLRMRNDFCHAMKPVLPPPNLAHDADKGRIL